MPARKTSGLPTFPWAKVVDNSFNIYRNSMQWYEMMAASAITIALRLTSISEDVKSNRLPDYMELQRMVSEKNDAWMKSATALTNWQHSAMRQTSRRLPASSAFGFPNLFTWAAVNSDFWSKAMATNIHLTGAALKGYAQMLKPYHSASTANAFRLSGVNRKR